MKAAKIKSKERLRAYRRVSGFIPKRIKIKEIEELMFESWEEKRFTYDPAGRCFYFITEKDIYKIAKRIGKE